MLLACTDAVIGHLQRDQRNALRKSELQFHQGHRPTAGVMEVNPSFPAKTIPEFIAYAKANPRKIMMASAGPGSAPGLYGELFKSMAGVDLPAVNYRGSPAALF